MSVKLNQEIARRFVQIWGQGNLDIIAELGAADITVQYPAMQRVITGPLAFRKMMEGFRAAFPDSSLHIDDVIAGGDKAVVRWTFSGTHQGPLMGIPPTGKKVSWTGITIYRIVDGKVVEERGEEDFLGLFRQLGLIRQP